MADIDIAELRRITEEAKERLIRKALEDQRAFEIEEAAQRKAKSAIEGIRNHLFKVGAEGKSAFEVLRYNEYDHVDRLVAEIIATYCAEQKLVVSLSPAYPGAVGKDESINYVKLVVSW